MNTPRPANRGGPSACRTSRSPRPGAARGDRTRGAGRAEEPAEGDRRGITNAAPANCTVRRCCEDWLTRGLPGRDPKTVAKNRYVLEPVLAVIGTVRLRVRDVIGVDKARAAMAVSRSGSTVAMARLALTRALTRAQAKNLALRNVSALTGTPSGTGGLRSRSMTLAQATALTTAAQVAGLCIDAYVMLSLCTGVRIEEARALRWEHVDFGGPAAASARLACVAVWRSVRARGDTKTRKSRRTLGLPRLAVTALHSSHEETGPQPGDLVFRTATGEPLDAANVRRSFRVVCRAAGIGQDWTPRELRHTFVRLMSDNNVAVEEIARLVGHASSKLTESVDRHQLRPVLTTGAEKMDTLLGVGG